MSRSLIHGLNTYIVVQFFLAYFIESAEVLGELASRLQNRTL